MITQEELKRHFEYREDGNLIWKIPTNVRRTKIGDVVGTLDNSNGYIRVGIKTKRYWIHRLIFMYHHGYMPRYVDHINGNRSDNRIENLRECNSSQNSWNLKKVKNTSGYKNVSFVKRDNTYSVEIKHDSGRYRKHGYKDPSVANCVAIGMRKFFHGEYARHI